ncbi:MAG: Bax inhibitor-1 family protein [Acetatifactor sp.]|nr:Bax inhibitor-1 family protein [Acetatifactor sp.]
MKGFKPMEDNYRQNNSSEYNFNNEYYSDYYDSAFSGNDTYSEFEANSDIIADSTYNLIIAAVLLWGFVINVVLIPYSDYIISKTGFFLAIIAYLILSMAGIHIAKRSKKPAISFLGYNMMVIPLGVIISPILSSYGITTLRYAFISTATATVLMLVLAILYPAIFISAGRGLFAAMSIGLITELIFMLFGLRPGIFDFIFVGVFCGYIGYDWALAQQTRKTVDAAIDSACSLYLDIINLFLRLLRLFGRASGSSKNNKF